MAAMRNFETLSLASEIEIETEFEFAKRFTSGHLEADLWPIFWMARSIKSFAIASLDVAELRSVAGRRSG